ncbi:hypothetical protein ACIGH6_05825 [Brachybacterium paraconglomeratum]|uniref:hypothetical protein n=1 Tax=Brachybacterium paraconglomeratum TaxID=173362 RepID=UPI0037C9F52C
MTALLLDTAARFRARAAHPRRCECDRDTLETPWKAEMCQILHARTQEERRALLDGFLFTHEVEIGRVLKRAQHISHLDYRDKDIVFSYFGDALMRMLSTRWLAKDGPGTSPVFNYSRNLPAILEAETRYWIREDRRKGLLNGTAGVPGDSSHDRRAKLVKRSRDLFEAEHGRPPAEGELVDFHNTRMRATRKDAARQSVLITVKSLGSLRAVPLEDPSLYTDDRMACRDVPDAGARERDQRVRSVIAECVRRDAERGPVRARARTRTPVLMASVARAFFARHREGEFPTRKELVEDLGVTEPASRREVGSHMNEILTISRTLFSDYRINN